MTSRLLTTVPQKYLIGLDCVVLSNLTEQSRKVRTGTLPSRGRRVQREHTAGLYHTAWHGQKAWIQIFVDKIPMPPRSLRWIRPLRELILGNVLYHEIGHHIHTLRPEYREKEDVADNWAVKLQINHLRRAYRPVYVITWLIAKTLRLFGWRRSQPARARQAH